MNFLDIIIKEMKICLLGGGFGVIRVNNFFYDGLFCFKFGR